MTWKFVVAILVVFVILILLQGYFDHPYSEHTLVSSTATLSQLHESERRSSLTCGKNQNAYRNKNDIRSGTKGSFPDKSILNYSRYTLVQPYPKIIVQNVISYNSTYIFITKSLLLHYQDDISSIIKEFFAMELCNFVSTIDTFHPDLTFVDQITMKKLSPKFPVENLLENTVEDQSIFEELKSLTEDQRAEFYQLSITSSELTTGAVTVNIRYIETSGLRNAFSTLHQLISLPDFKVNKVDFPFLILDWPNYKWRGASFVLNLSK